MDARIPQRVSTRTLWTHFITPNGQCGICGDTGVVKLVEFKKRKRDGKWSYAGDRRCICPKAR